MEKPDQNIKLSEGKHRRLGYAQEFRQMVAEHPGILRTALELTERAEREYDPGILELSDREGMASMEPMGHYQTLKWDKKAENWRVIRDVSFGGHGEMEDVDRLMTDQFHGTRGTYLKAGEPVVDPENRLEVTVLGKISRDLEDWYGPLGKDKTTYLKVKFGNKSFFVKKSSATINPGFEEFKHSTIMKDALVGIDNLRVVEAQLGFTDNNQSWFVSEWEDLEDAGFYDMSVYIGGLFKNDYGDTLVNHSHRWAREEQHRAMEDEITRRAKAAGINLADLRPNLFYNFDTNQYFLLDVTQLTEAQLGQEQK